MQVNEAMHPIKGLSLLRIFVYQLDEPVDDFIGHAVRFLAERGRWQVQLDGEESLTNLLPDKLRTIRFEGKYFSIRERENA